MNRILIIRPSAMGDIVMASPMIDTLRRAYPDAFIAWLADPALAVLIRQHPGIDEIIPWSKGHWQELARGGNWLQIVGEIRKLAASLRSRRFDLVLDVQGLLRSRLLARLSGARERVGFDSKEPGRFLMTRIVSRGPDSDRMSSEYRFLMESMGLNPGEFPPHLEVAAEDDQAAVDLLQREMITGAYAVFAPFTTRPQKHWFDERWSALAEEIGSRMNLNIIILGGSADAVAATRIAGLAPGRVHSLAGNTNLGQSVALIRRCELLIGVDTGLTHMGTAFRRPTVALFGSTCPYQRTSSSRTRVLYDPQPCSPCRRHPTCDGRFTCMEALTVDRVVGAAAELLEMDRQA